MLHRRPHELTVDELREILRLPNHLIAIIRPDGTFYKVNEETNPILGWEPDEVIGQQVRDYVHPEDWEETYTHMTSVFLGMKPIVEDLRNRIRRKDGTWRWISWTGRATGGYIYAHGSDVTDKVEYEEALTVQSLVLESISEGVVICNQKAVIVFANTAAEKLYGYEMEEMLGMKLFALSGMSRDLSKIKVRDALETLNSEKLWMGEFENIRKDGTIFSTACRVTTLDLHGERHFVCVQRDISAKKRFTREREELETRFRTFFEQSALPMIIFDAQGNPLDVNHAWELLYDINRSELEGYNLLQDEAYIEMGIRPYIDRALAGEVVMTPPFYLDPAKLEGGKGKKGRARWLEAWFSPIKNSDGTTRELAMILKDVTDQISTQETLREMETKFRIASESLSLAVRVGQVGVWEWFPADNRVIWDETSEKIYGFEKGTFPQTVEAYTALLHPADAEYCWKAVEESFRTRNSYHIVHRIFRKDGAVRWLQGSGMPFFNEANEVVRVVGTTMDISDRKEIEEDQKFFAEISEILSSSFDYVTNTQRVLDLSVRTYFDGAIVDEIDKSESRRIAAANLEPELREIMMNLNKDYYRSVGMAHPFLQSLKEPKEIIIQNADELLSSPGLPEEYVRKSLQLRMKSGYIATLQGKNGPMGTFGFHLRKENPNGLSERLIRLGREIGTRISLALENSLLYHHSLEAIRARDEFLSIASHELKTPLQSLTLQNEMKRRQISRGEKAALEPAGIIRALDMDKRQLNRINRLIDDMLDIARIRNARLSVHKESFDLISLLTDVADRLQPQFESAGCELHRDYSGELILMGDSYRIEQVLVNILVNAMKYGAGKPVFLRVKKLSHQAVVEVEDRGPGILDEDKERIFHRFERAISSREVSGLGLGLYISREIMELHQGKIHVTSEREKGSTFILEFPL